jgi:hypothetical protein
MVAENRKVLMLFEFVSGLETVGLPPGDVSGAQFATILQYDAGQSALIEMSRFRCGKPGPPKRHLKDLLRPSRLNLRVSAVHHFRPLLILSAITGQCWNSLLAYRLAALVIIFGRCLTGSANVAARKCGLNDPASASVCFLNAIPEELFESF